MIRTARPKDIAAVMKLIKSHSGTLLHRSAKEIRAALPNVWVAEDGGKVVGCVTLDIYNKKIAEIRSLAVDASQRKKGIGRQLVLAALREAKRRKIPEVLAVSSSKEFFERLHFGICLREKYAMFWDGTIEAE